MKKYLIYYIVTVLCLLGLSRLTWGAANNGVFQMIYFIACLIVIFVLQALVRSALVGRAKELDEGAYRRMLRRMSGQRIKGEAEALRPEIALLERWWRCCKALSAVLVILAVLLLGLTFL